MSATRQYPSQYPTGRIAALLVALVLASCGGRDDPSSGPSLGGVAATGAPMGAAAITVTCASGPPIATTTSATGAWSVSLPEGTAVPCLVKAVGGTPPVTLFSIAAATGNVNVTPLTHLVVAAAAGADPEAWAGSPPGGLAAGLGQLSANMAAAKAALVQSLADAGYALPAGDFMTATFNPAPGDPLDDLLEAVAKGTKDSGMTYADLVDQVAAAGTTPVVVPKSDELTAAQVAAQPRLNGAAVTVSNNTALLSTATGSHAIGAFFGGGTGNKAVLQIPGVAGLKLKDFEQMSLEVKPLTPLGVGHPYVYVNMLVDLDCSAPPLAANATAAQVRERRRVLIYDPFYKFIQDNPGTISTTGYTTMTITPASGGWRISAGAVADPTGQGDTGVEEAVHGSQFKLTGFHHHLYPNACIVDGVSADGGLFRETATPACNTGAALAGTAPASCGKAHSGFLVILGDSATATLAQWEVRKVKVNQRMFTFR